MAGKENYAVGLTQEEGKICKLGCPCCVQACMKPDMADLIKCGFDCLCVSAKGNFPFADPVPEPICALYGAQCAQKDGKPIFGCCNPPYEDGAFKSFRPAGAPPANETMSR